MRKTGFASRFAGILTALVTLSWSTVATAPSGTLDELRSLLQQGEFAKVESGALLLLAEVEVAEGAESLAVAKVLDVLAESLWRGGKAHEPETRNRAERALRIKERLLGPDHADVAESLNNVATIAFFLGDYAAARPPWERALALRERVLGADHLDVAQSLNSLGNLLQTIGDYEGAKRCHGRALAIREKALGPEDRYVAQTLNNLGYLYSDLGDFVAARAAFERALAIRQKVLGPGHPMVASSLNALAGLLWKTGDREPARQRFERALALWKEALGPEHPYVGSSMNNLGWLLMNAGKYSEAKPLLEGALAVFRSAQGPEHYDVAQALNNLGTLHRYTGDLVQARELLEQAATIREKALGPDHPDLAETLSTLGRVLFGMGEVDAARGRFERALAIRKKTLGAEHPDVAESLADLALLFTATGQTSAATDLALESESIAREHLRLTARSLSEQEALRYAAVRNRGLDLALTLASSESDLDSRRRVVDSLILSRAVVLDEIASRRRAVVASDDPHIVRLADDLAQSRARLANLTVRGLGDEDPDRYRSMLDLARDEKEGAERALALASAAFRQERDRRDLGLREVAAGLPAGSGLVAFVLHDRTVRQTADPEGKDAGKILPPTSESAYTAVVLRNQDGPWIVPLGAAAEIDPLVSTWKREASMGGQNTQRSAEESVAAYRQAGEALRRRIWDPLAARLSGASMVFLVPDGAINLVSFASLPIGPQSYLIEGEQLLQYLSAERDLVTLAGAVALGRGLLAVGGPDYDHAAGAATTSSTPNAVVAPDGSTTRSACGSFDTLRFRPLPGSEREAREIAAKWREVSPRTADDPDDVIHQSGQAATESAFKFAAVGRRVLHVATHGFFLGGECTPASTRSRGLTIRDEPERPPIPDLGLSPLLVSGLAFAGANERRSAGRLEGDGVLTAEEIASLDLSGVEWAVLSACDTGVGEIGAGEGVFGLRRAMQVAGVRTLIMSLWPVDDEATRMWMSALYDSRLSEGSGTALAVRAAGLSILAGRRQAGTSSHPFYWAAFVAAGAWQ